MMCVLLLGGAIGGIFTGLTDTDTLRYVRLDDDTDTDTLRYVRSDTGTVTDIEYSEATSRNDTGTSNDEWPIIPGRGLWSRNDQEQADLSYDLQYTFADGTSTGSGSDTAFLPSGPVRSGISSHPLASERTTLVDLEEIAIGNQLKAGGGMMWVFDDTFNRLRQLHSAGYPSENLGGSDMTAGDLDGDGLDELVISSEVNVLENGENVSMTLVGIYDDETTDFRLLNSTVYWFTSASLSSGDLDGDGLDEVVLVGKYQGNLTMAGVVFDDLLAPELIHHLWNPDTWKWGPGPDPTMHHDVATGDFDGDGLDEIATVGYFNDTLISRVWAWNSEPEGDDPVFDGVHEISLLPEMHDTMGQPSICSGEIDGDDRDELIITTHDNEWKLHYWIYDDRSTNFSLLGDIHDDAIIRSTDVATGDVDGDGLDEILIVGHQTAHLIGRIIDDSLHDFDLLKVLDYIPDDIWFYWFNVVIKTGDIDGDGYDEYAILGQSYKHLYFEVHDDLLHGEGELLDSWLIGDNKLPTLAIGEFDGDGLILEYSGEHGPVETPAIPLVVVAPPPVFDSSGEGSSGIYTGFGLTPPDVADGSNHLIVSAELGILFEGEPIDLTNGQRSALLSEFDASQTPVLIQGTNISFQGQYPGDHVVHLRIVYEQYTYRILSWPGNTDRIGENISFLVPVSITIDHSLMSVYGTEGSVLAGAGIRSFDHQGGDVTRYPDAQERDGILASSTGWISDPVFMEEGSGPHEVTVSPGQLDPLPGMLEYGSSWPLLMESLDGHSATGIFSDAFYGVSIGEDTVFEGIIQSGNRTDELSETGTEFGMFVHTNDLIMDDLTILVIDYWVEPRYDPDHQTDAPTGNWSFDSILGDGTTPDTSPSGNHAFVTGASLINGLRGNALRFDGIDDSVGIILDRAYPNFTIELWARSTMIGGELFALFETSTGADILLLGVDLIAEFPHIRSGGSSDSGSIGLVADEEWHHLVMTGNDTGSRKLYIDGVLEDETLQESDVPQPGDHFVIGYDLSGNPTNFDGAIDEVRIFDRVLNATEVSGNFDTLDPGPSYPKGDDQNDDPDRRTMELFLSISLIMVLFACLIWVLKVY